MWSFRFIEFIGDVSADDVGHDGAEMLFFAKQRVESLSVPTNISTIRRRHDGNLQKQTQEVKPSITLFTVAVNKLS